jgi:hypothetical protein
MLMSVPPVKVATTWNPFGVFLWVVFGASTLTAIVIGSVLTGSLTLRDGVDPETGVQTLVVSCVVAWSLAFASLVGAIVLHGVRWIVEHRA